MDRGQGEIYVTGGRGETARLRPRLERGCLCSATPGGQGWCSESHASPLSIHRAWAGTVQHQVLLKKDGLSSTAPRPGCSLLFWAPLSVCLTSKSCRAQLWICPPSSLSECLLL